MKSIQIAIALTFTVSHIPFMPQTYSVASAQMQAGFQGQGQFWGTGQWGANQMCPYPVSPNPGSTDKKDAIDMLKDKLKSKKLLLATKQKRADTMSDRLSTLEDQITGYVGSAWWNQISAHMTGKAECCLHNSKELTATTASYGVVPFLNGLNVAANPMMPATRVSFSEEMKDSVEGIDVIDSQTMTMATNAKASQGNGRVPASSSTATNSAETGRVPAQATFGAGASVRAALVQRGATLAATSTTAAAPATPAAQTTQTAATQSSAGDPLVKPPYPASVLDRPECKALSNTIGSTQYNGAVPAKKDGQDWYKNAVNNVYAYYFDTQDSKTKEDRKCRIEVFGADGKKLTGIAALTLPNVTDVNNYARSVAKYPVAKGENSIPDRCKHIWAMNRGAVYTPSVGGVDKSGKLLPGSKAGTLSINTNSTKITAAISNLVVVMSDGAEPTEPTWKKFIADTSNSGYSRIKPTMTSSQIKEVIRQDMAFYMGARCDKVLEVALEKPGINIVTDLSNIPKWNSAYSAFKNILAIDSKLKTHKGEPYSLGAMMVPAMKYTLAAPPAPAPVDPPKPAPVTICDAEHPENCPKEPAPGPSLFGVNIPKPTFEIPDEPAPEPAPDTAPPTTTTETTCSTGTCPDTTPPAKPVTCPAGAPSLDDELKVSDWKAICQKKGKFDINKVCSSSVYSSAKGGDVGRCKAAIASYIKLTADSDKIQSTEIADLQTEIDRLEDLISEIQYRKSAGEDYDDIIAELEGKCTDCPHTSDSATEPQKGIDWGNVITGVAPALANMVVGIYGNYKNNQTIQQNQDQFYKQQIDARDLATRLGYPYTVQPFPSTGGNNPYGYPFGQGGIYGAVAGGLGAGGFGCSSGIGGAGQWNGPYGGLSQFGNSGGLYGPIGQGPMYNPYGMNMTGGGMYMPGANPYGANGYNPWMSGGQMGAGAGFQIGGSMGVGAGMNPYGGGQMGVCVVGVMSACNGNMYGGGQMGGGAGFNGGMAGGVDSYYQYQQQMLQYQQQQQQAQQARMQSAQALYAEMYQLQMRIQQIMNGYGTGDMYSNTQNSLGFGVSGSVSGSVSGGTTPLPGSGTATSPGSTNIGAGQ